MSITTTRSLAELRAQCDALGVPNTEFDSRADLFDRLRAKIGEFDPSRQIDPMKAVDLKSKIAWGTESPFDGIRAYLTDAWVAEPKLDGARMRLFLGGRSNAMNTGRRSVKTFAYIDRTDNFPHLRDAAVEVLAGTVIDGEVLAPTSKLQTHTGTWTDSLLNASVALVNSGPEGSQATQRRFGRAQFWAFDVLQLQGVDVTDRPYAERRKLLEVVVGALQSEHPNCEVRLVAQLPACVESITESLRLGFEGVMLKRLAAKYQPGKRSKDWAKVKTFSTADGFVVGYAVGEGRNQGLVGSLDLAVYEPCTEEEFETSKLPVKMIGGVFHKHVAVAQVGNLTDDMRRAISASDGSLKAEWYGRVIEFQGQGVAKNQRVRHPHMVRLRPDKAPEDCLIDQLSIFPRV